MPAAFLMQQMAWREALDEAGADTAAVQALDEQVQAAQHSLLARLGQTLDADTDLAADPAAGARDAAGQVRGLMFVDRFRADIARRLEALDA